MKTLSIDKRSKVRQMREDGMYLKEIACEFDAPISTISRVCRMQENEPHRKNQQAARSCIYPNISSWMSKNNCSYTELAKMMGEIQIDTVRKFLTGASGGKKPTIDKILFVTGLSYEVAFATCQDEADSV